MSDIYDICEPFSQAIGSMYPYSSYEMNSLIRNAHFALLLLNQDVERAKENITVLIRFIQSTLNIMKSDLSNALLPVLFSDSAPSDISTPEGRDRYIRSYNIWNDGSKIVEKLNGILSNI